MYFGTYSWAQLPHTLTVRHNRKTELAANEQGVWSLVDQGDTGRTVQAEGSFCGPYAYAYFESLITLFQAGKAQTLSLPTWGKMTALMTELTLTEEPCADYVRYQITFRELPKLANPT